MRSSPAKVRWAAPRRSPRLDGFGGCDRVATAGVALERTLASATITSRSQRLAGSSWVRSCHRIDKVKPVRPNSCGGARTTRPSGPASIELAGPREYGKPIVAQQEPEEAMAAALMGAGMNSEWARLFQEFTPGVNTGRVVWEGGHPLWRGETDVETILVSLVGGR